MRRSVIVAFAVFASALLVAVPVLGAPAGSAEYVVGGKHTDFGTGSEASPQALTNLTVDGSGDGATVSIKPGNTFRDSFDNEPADSGVPDAWKISSGSTTTNFDIIEVQSPIVNDGTQAYHYKYTASGGARILPTDQPYSTAITKPVSFDMYVPSESRIPQFFIGEGGTRIATLRLNEGDLEWYDNTDSTTTTLSTAVNRNEWIQLSVKNIDPSANEATVEWSSSGGASGSQVVSLDLTNGYTSTKIGSGDGEAYIDDFRIGGPNFASAGYVSAIHNVDGAQEAAINITAASNVSVDATIRTDGGTTLGSGTFTTAGNHTVSLSSTSSSQIETVLNVTVTGDNPQFTLADESILFAPHAPDPDNATATPSGGTSQNSEDATLSIDVSDEDFGTAQGDTVSADFYVDGLLVGSTTTSSNGTISTTATGLSDGSHTWHVELSDSYGETSTSDTFSFEVIHKAPNLTLQSPADGAEITDASPTLEATVRDYDFDVNEDTVDVNFLVREPGQSNFSVVDTVSISANQTVSTSIVADIGGNWEWKVNATDTYNFETTSNTRTFQVPAKLYVKNVSEPSQAVTDGNATVRFFGDNTVLTRDLNTTTGAVNLTGLPADERLVAKIDAPNYYTRTVTIGSLYEQQIAYLLPTSVSAVEKQFQLDDQTGNYPPDETVLEIQRPLNVSGNTQYETVAGDYFSATNSYTVMLEEETRYRLRIVGPDGDTRILGHFQPTAAGVETLTVGQLRIDVPDDGTYAVQAWVEQLSDGSEQLRFEYVDPTGKTSEVCYAAHERYNKTNVVVAETCVQDFGEATSATVALSNASANLTLMVDWSATRASTTNSGSISVGISAASVPLDNRWLFTGSYIAVVVMGLLYPDRIATYGALATSVLLGMFIVLGWTNIPATAWWAGTSIAVAGHVARTGGEI